MRVIALVIIPRSSSDHDARKIGLALMERKHHADSQSLTQRQRPRKRRKPSLTQATVMIDGKRKTVRATPDSLKQLRRAAQEQRWTLSEYIRLILEIEERRLAAGGAPATPASLNSSP